MTELPIGALIAPDSVVRTILPNGLTVLVRRDRSAPVVAVVTYVNAGYFDETDDVIGIAHVLEHMYFKGTATRGVGEIAKQTKAAGGYLNAATIYDHTIYYTVLPASSLAEGLEVQADAYANSQIDADELRRELEVIIQEAKRKADDPSSVATETLYELLHQSHRIRRWRIGREPGLRALTRGNVVGFYRNFYRPSNTVLSIVGDVDPDTTLTQLERLYGSAAAGTPIRTPGPAEAGPPAGFSYREWAGDIGQAQLAFGWQTPGTLHIDTPALDLLAAVLGSGRASRLYRAVRERQLAATIGAYNYTPTELGVFVIHAEGRSETTLEAARSIWDEVRRMRDGEIGVFEIERAKRMLESGWVRRLEDMEGQASYLAEWQALGDWRLGEWYLERLLGCGQDELTRVARDWLIPGRAAAVVYRPAESQEIAADAAAMQTLLDDGLVPEPRPVTSRLAKAVQVQVPGRPTVEREVAGVRIYRTARGIPVLVRSKAGAPLVHLGAFVLGGGCDELEEMAGITTLMARTAAKGTESRATTQIAEEAEMLGGAISSSVGSDHFGWSISVPAMHTAAAIELLSDVVQHPTFDLEALKTERAAAIADVIAVRDDMYRYPMRLASQAAFAGHPYGIPVSGTEASLGRIEPSDLRDWHRRRVLRAPVVVALVGGGDPDELARAAIRWWDRLELAEPSELRPPVWPSVTEVRVELRDRAQTALAILFPGPSRSDDDRFAADMISGVASGLGGRFFDVLRDQRSLCYSVQAFPSERALAGAFVAYIATSPEKEEAAREGLLAEFQRLRDELVTPQELARAQRYAIGTHQIHRQSGGAVLGEVVDAWLFGDLRELDQHDEQIRGVTAESMQRLALKYFDPERRVEGVVRGTERVV